LFTDATMENSQEHFTEELWRPLLTQNQMFQTLVTPTLPSERKSWVIKLQASLLRAGNKVDRDHIII